MSDPDNVHDEEEIEHKEVLHKEHHSTPRKSSPGVNKYLKWLVAVGVVQAILLVIVAMQISGLNGMLSGGAEIQALAAPTGQAAAAPQPSAPTPTVDMEQLMDDDEVKGDADAPVTIIEFSDFECPFCGRFHQQTFGQIDDTYIKTGKVKFIYRDFPLSFHQNAQKAAEASECAKDQGKFWEMHDKLFTDGVAGGVGSFKQFARDLGLNGETFNTCLDTNAKRGEVQKDFQDGQRAGVQGTPGFFVNGQEVSGAQPFQVFQQIIEAELAK